MSDLFKAINKPRRLPSLRGTGFGMHAHFCAKCGAVMLGHNRGLCSRCMRGAGGAVAVPHEPPVRMKFTTGNSPAQAKRQVTKDIRKALGTESLFTGRRA